MLKRILIANRGEIARRIARTCRRLGVEYVAVHSDADAGALHLQGAVAVHALGGSAASESYLDAAKLIAAAKTHGCDAIHPGYGFLSENAGFAKAVVNAGLVFVGPKSETIAALGDKARAKALMKAAGVPVVPGAAEATEDLAQIAELARHAGYPVLLKPSAGGGGKGMQVVHDEAGLSAAAEQAIRLARANFADGRLLVEHYVERPRHVEVQIFGDTHGNVVHLFERECSLQRRHQKVIEEAPDAGLDASTREALLAAAVRGAKAIGYVNAGTFEFIVGARGFFFLEVNTRLQVEHPVTEEITGLDLVEWQLRVAAGEPLPRKQAEITRCGHAVELRIYAEDARRDFAPAPGHATYIRWPSGVRVEAALEGSGTVSPFYDPMIAKLVVRGEDRAQALASARRALDATIVLGLTSNVGFLRRVLADPNVEAGVVHTRYLDDVLDVLRGHDVAGRAAACAFATTLTQTAPDVSPWQRGAAPVDRAALTSWLGRTHYWHGRDLLDATLLRREGGREVVEVKGTRHVVTVDARDGAIATGTIDGERWHAMDAGGAIELMIGGERASLVPFSAQEPARAGGGGQGVAPMPGVVTAIAVSAGDVVAEGDTLAVVEAMKMENRVVAPFAGEVTAVHVKLRDNVRAGEVLVTVEAR